MLLTWYRLKVDALAMFPMNSGLDAKLSTPGFVRFAPAFCPEPSDTPAKSCIRRRNCPIGV